VPLDETERATLALELDRAMRESAPAGWKGDPNREIQVLNALYPIMARDREATQAVFDIIKNQPVIDAGDDSTRRHFGFGDP